MIGAVAFRVAAQATVPMDAGQHAALWLALFLLTVGAVYGFAAMQGRLLRALGYGLASVSCTLAAWAVWGVLHA